MRSNPRGHALIINIFKTVGMDDRKGSDVDLDKLKNLFHQLGFVVHAFENLTDDVNQFSNLISLTVNSHFSREPCILTSKYETW